MEEKIKVSSRDLLRALRRRYCEYNHWIYGEEVRLGTGYDIKSRYDYVMGDDGKWHKARRTSIEQRIDAFAMSCFPSDSFRKIAFEIKVSRADFLREIADPIKRAGALELSNMFYFVTPPALVKASELPEECGLIELRGDLLRIIKRAPDRKCAEPSWSFIASFIRNCSAGAIEQHLFATQPERDRLSRIHAREIERLQVEIKQLREQLRLMQTEKN